MLGFENHNCPKTLSNAQLCKTAKDELQGDIDRI